MNINQVQKDLLIGVIEHAIKTNSIAESMEFGEDLIYLKNEVEVIEVRE